MWEMGFANQRGETALQEENDRVGLNGVNCRNSLRVNCSTIELGTQDWEWHRSKPKKQERTLVALCLGN
jgi:hypothetical protein